MQNNNPKAKGDLRQRVYRYALGIVRFIDSLDKSDSTVQIISRQLLRSATSVGANIIEAQAGSTKKDFTIFYTHALKSANESKFWLCLLCDARPTLAGSAAVLLTETIEIANILAASILTLKGKR